jgi:hypothetical protein
MISQQDSSCTRLVSVIASHIPTFQPSENLFRKEQLPTYNKRVGHENRAAELNSLCGFFYCWRSKGLFLESKNFSTKHNTIQDSTVPFKDTDCLQVGLFRSPLKVLCLSGTHLKTPDGMSEVLGVYFFHTCTPYLAAPVSFKCLLCIGRIYLPIVYMVSG